MSENKPRLIGSLIIPAILAGLWIAYQPQGSWAGIFLLTGLIAAGAGATVFFSGTGSRVFAAPIALLFLFGAYSSANWGTFNEEAFTNLNTHVPAYASNLDYIEERSNHPHMKRGESIWRIRTPDTMEQVSAFYENPTNAGELSRVKTKDPKMIVFRGTSKTVAIELSRNSGITEILYRVSEAVPASGEAVHASVGE